MKKNSYRLWSLFLVCLIGCSEKTKIELVDWAKVESVNVDEINSDIEIGNPTIDIGIYFPSNLDPSFKKVTLEQLVSGFKSAKEIYKPTSVQLNLLWVKTGEIDKKFLLNGVRLKVCKTRVTDSELFNGSKHLNRIDNVLAKSELNNSEFDGLMLDKNGFINECASSNIFARYGKVIASPSQINAGVSGVCKQIVVDNASRLGFVYKVKNIKLSQLKKADEVFITNSIFGALHVSQIEEKKWKGETCTSILRNLIINSKN